MGRSLQCHRGAEDGCCLSASRISDEKAVACCTQRHEECTASHTTATSAKRSMTLLRVCFQVVPLTPEPAFSIIARASRLPKKPASVLLISPAQNLKHRPVLGSEVIAPRLARTLDGTNERDAFCVHGRACCIDIVHPAGDHRTRRAEPVTRLLG